MAVQSRRAAQNGRGAVKQQRQGKGVTAPDEQDPSTRSLHNTIHEHGDDDGPPGKRRKLSIRNKQHTLDDNEDFARAQITPLKPPTKLMVAQPHGNLLETVNGVRTVLDVAEDDLPLPRSGRNTASPEKLPKPAPTPQQITKQEDKRSLRSHDEGPRLKSELATYFPNYEDIIFDVEKEQDFITVDTSIYITDDAPSRTKVKQPSLSPLGISKPSASPSQPHTSAVNGWSSSAPSSHRRTTPKDLNGHPRVNLSLISGTVFSDTVDPLPDEHYLISHRRAERREKQLRNIEKERAMHEKVQLDRLLAGLQGHDWLKVLGITGITDGEARKFEAKRDYFIAEVWALVDKFRVWKEQEKKLRLEREAAILARDDEGEEEEESEDPVCRSTSPDPPSSDLNASASRQLQQETVRALKTSTTTTKPRQKPPLLLFPEIPITSFYSKRYMRDAALGKSRSHGRNVTAFGHALPDVEEREFELPEEYVTRETLRANAREKRRRKRENIANATARSVKG